MPWGGVVGGVWVLVGGMSGGEVAGGGPGGVGWGWARWTCGMLSRREGRRVWAGG